MGWDHPEIPITLVVNREVCDVVTAHDSSPILVPSLLLTLL